MALSAQVFNGTELAYGIPPNDFGTCPIGCPQTITNAQVMGAVGVAFVVGALFALSIAPTRSSSVSEEVKAEAAKPAPRRAQRSIGHYTPHWSDAFANLHMIQFNVQPFFQAHFIDPFQGFFTGHDFVVIV